MKKVLAIILALAMVLSFAALAACDNGSTANNDTQTETQNNDNQQQQNNDQQETNTSPTVTDTDELFGDTTTDDTVTEEMLDNSLPREYVPEKIAAGREVLIGWSLNSFEGAGAPIQARFDEEFPKLGLTYVSALDGGDTAQQITNIENFITMGCSAILIQTSDISLLEDVVGRAEAAGSACILYGDIPQFPMSGYTSVDLEAMGYAAGLIVRAWLDIHNPDAAPGSVKVAFHGFYVVMPTKLISDSMQKAIEDDERCTVVYTEENVSGIEAGYAFAERAMTTDREIRVLAGYNLLSNYGVNNYIMAQPDLDPTEFCVASTMWDGDLDGFIANTEAGEGCLVGTIYGESDPAWGYLTCLHEILWEGKTGVAEMQNTYFYGVSGIDIDSYMDQYYYNN